MAVTNNDIFILETKCENKITKELYVRYGNTMYYNDESQFNSKLFNFDCLADLIKCGINNELYNDVQCSTNFNLEGGRLYVTLQLCLDKKPMKRIEETHEIELLFNMSYDKHTYDKYGVANIPTNTNLVESLKHELNLPIVYPQGEIVKYEVCFYNYDNNKSGINHVKLYDVRVTPHILLLLNSFICDTSKKYDINQMRLYHKNIDNVDFDFVFNKLTVELQQKYKNYKTDFDTFINFMNYFNTYLKIQENTDELSYRQKIISYVISVILDHHHPYVNYINCIDHHIKCYYGVDVEIVLYVNANQQKSNKYVVFSNLDTFNKQHDKNKSYFIIGNSENVMITQEL